MATQIQSLIVGIKGAGEMASAIAWRLHRSGIRQIFMMEQNRPLAVRRRVSFSETVYCTQITIEGISGRLEASRNQIFDAWAQGHIAVIIDPTWNRIQDLTPDVVVDATIAKKNLGTVLSEAPLVIGVGPGFEAGKDVHLVVETNRGHNLGRVLPCGRAEKNTGIPGAIAGITSQRVLRAPVDGLFTSTHQIGFPVVAGEVIGRVGNIEVTASIPGILRGLIKPGTKVRKKMKIGDIDPRANSAYCTTISDKARAVSGGVIEAVLRNLIPLNSIPDATTIMVQKN